LNDSNITQNGAVGNTELCGVKTFIPFKRFLGRGAGSSLFIPLVISRCPLLSFAAKLLYGRLCFRAGKDGECFPSEADLCHELGVVDRDGGIGPSQLRTLRNYLAELKAVKLILVQPRYNKRGERTTNAYRFLENELLNDGHIHRKKSSAGHRREFSGKEQKNPSGKVWKDSSDIKETSSSKEKPLKRNSELKEEVEQTARIGDASPSEANGKTAPRPKTNNPLPPKNDDENPKPKTFLGERDGQEQVPAPVAVLKFRADASANPDAWAELFKLAPDISLTDEQWLKEQAELKGATPGALLELAKQNREPRAWKSGPVAALKYLVNNFNRKSMSAALHHATANALGIRRPQIIEQPKCAKCKNVGQLTETEYCDCSQGAEVKHAVEKLAAERAAKRSPPGRESVAAGTAASG
jgi:hypothetical protein